MEDKNERNGVVYPFNEGNDYWTIEDGEIIWSCWDDVSEEMHDKNPNKEYFMTKESAINHLKQIEQMEAIDNEYKKVKEKLTRYYEVDLDNCKMTNKMWVEELAKCMIDSDDYVKDFNLNLKQYDDERNA
jgi:hypothetical protein